MVYEAKKGRAKVSTTYRSVFLAAGGRSLLSVLAHLILGRQTLSSGMISSGYFVEKGIVARTEENGEEADTSPGNTGIKLIPFLAAKAAQYISRNVRNVHSLVRLWTNAK